MSKKIIDLLKNPYVLIGSFFSLPFLFKIFALFITFEKTTMLENITKLSKSSLPTNNINQSMLFFICFVIYSFIAPILEELIFRSWLTKKFHLYSLPFLYFSFYIFLKRITYFSSDFYSQLDLFKHVKSTFFAMLLTLLIYYWNKRNLKKSYFKWLITQIPKFNYKILIFISTVSFVSIHNYQKPFEMFWLILGSLLLGYTTYKLNLKIAIYLHSFWNIMVTFTFIKLENNIMDVWFYYLVYLLSSVLLRSAPIK
jgi:membrane protease YdiL (CAAX protease family)